MSEFQPITKPEDLSGLDDNEMVSGYCSGYCGDAEPGSDKSRAFWHGWRNGAVDGGHRQMDTAQAELARCLVAQQRLH
ncbi:hypothetical protein [Cupriavidus basilensis]|uniref:hypothetical protein n=1 Tax=Cupriavidus basilensis TaxID=68895 RepID=UPI0005B771A1|nr:hypothetical protein [Cupriavidus basilensis]